MNKPVGFSKPEIKGSGAFIPPKPKQLDKSCGVGDYVITNAGYVGILQKWNSDSDIASILSDNEIKDITLFQKNVVLDK